jgi:hypothetical protein
MLPRLLERFNELLDQTFEDGMREFVKSLARLWRTGSALRAAFDEVRAAAETAESRAERLRPDDPSISAFLDALEVELNGLAGALGTATNAIVIAMLSISGSLARQISLPRSRDNLWRPLRIEDLLRAGLRNYISRPEFAQMLRGFGAASVAQVRRAVTREFMRGTSPLRLALLLQRFARRMPEARAMTIARTLQLQTWRDATVLHYQANSDLVTHMIRVAALDGRTCLACIALHGTRLELGEALQDHYNGRCTAIGVTRFTPRAIETGEQWFRRQPPSFQRRSMGGAAWRAWRAGAVVLDDFVEEVDDPLFGEMVREASLRGILGSAARDYYAK